MDKMNILQRLKDERDLLNNTIGPLANGRFFERTLPDRWSAAENVYHLILAVRPLNFAFSLPLFIVRLFGKPNRESRTYQEVVARYQQQLKEGAKASLLYIPPEHPSISGPALIDKFNATYELFSEKVGRLPEGKMDQYVLPHPILGMLTLREMLYFTIYHIHHHHLIIKERL